MNKIILIGNLTRDPELRTIPSGVNVCSFGLAVNRRRGTQSNGQPEVDYFNITAWRQLGELCQRYLAKGRKVCVTGSVSVRTYEGKDGQTRASLEVTADDIEFLSSRQDDAAMGSVPAAAPAANSSMMAGGFTQVDEDELPF